VAIPRGSFDRRSNAELVAAGLHTLGVPALVSERNDIVVDKFKISSAYPSSRICFYLLSSYYVSGSAYKIANKRAYHHGTMLISAQLNSLGDLLKNQKVCPHLGIIFLSSPFDFGFLGYACHQRRRLCSFARQKLARLCAQCHPSQVRGCCFQGICEKIRRK
jgi:Lipoyl protein ligase A/B catalytic domain